MSRIGILPIALNNEVSVKVEDKLVIVKGNHGELKTKLSEGINLEITENSVIVSRKNDSKVHKSQHGLMRSLINNMVTGVSNPFVKKLELVGVGYRANSVGQLLELNLGFSHPIFLELSKEISIETTAAKRQNSIITLKSIDKQLLGQVAAKIRSFKKPEPYKGKGILFVGEIIRRKAGKTAGAK